MEELDFASVFEAQPTATAVLSPDLVIRAVNRAYEEMTGHGRGEVVGRHLFELPGASSSGPELRASLERVLADGVTDIIALTRYDLEKPGEPGTLEERHWSVVNAPVPDADGGVGLIVQRIEEITPFLDRSREQILSSAGSTAERVRQIEVELLARAQDLQEVNQRLRVTQDHQRRTVQILQRQIESHREALADTSHDLKNPITGLQLRLEEALADLDTDPDDDLRQMLLAALHDAEHLDAIVSELLELARLDSGTPMDTERLDLAELVRDELTRHPPTNPTIMDLRPGTIVEGSAVQLTRLLNNLVSNADRHARSRIEVRVTAEDDWAVLEVIDDGPGIPAADREAAFRRFYRHRESRRLNPQGTGLGLPISRKIAGNHGGTLHIADNPTGARLVLRLPVVGGPVVTPS